MQKKTQFIIANVQVPFLTERKITSPLFSILSATYVTGKCAFALF